MVDEILNIILLLSKFIRIISLLNCLLFEMINIIRFWHIICTFIQELLNSSSLGHLPF
jgi:hypothetical protein